MIYKTCIRFGLQPSEYWEMSFEEINAFLEVMQEKEKDQYKYDVSMQFYNAVFNNAKRPYEAYQEIINELDKKEMTNDEMENMARRLNAIFGGKTVKKGGD